LKSVKPLETGLTLEHIKRVAELFSYNSARDVTEESQQEEFMAKHSGVDVDHPAIVDTIKNSIRQGRSTEHIMKITGMPKEVVHKYEHQVRQEQERGDKKTNR